MKIVRLALLLLVFTTMQADAQKLVKGHVTSVEANPLEGVTVAIKGSTVTTTTDRSGAFSINMPEEKNVLIFSFIGKITKEVKVLSNAPLTVVLENKAEVMDEVVAIGYGSARKKDLTTAVANVKNVGSISSRAVSNVNDFLQGATPGVTVLQQGGDPSANAKIVIRGVGSLATETPLTVVDGVPYYGPPINPNDIESISILKDAASASVYGAQAASGVIVITTKKGKQGKPLISIDLLSGMQQAANLPTPLTAKQQADVYNLAADNGGTSRLAAHDASKNPWGQVNRTNWIDAIFRNAMFYNGNAAISGAKEGLNYYSSFGYQKKEGLLVGTEFERYAVRVKTDFNILDNFTVGENISYSHTNALGARNTSSYSGNIINAMYMPSAAPVYDSLGNFHGTVPYYLKDFAGAYGDVYNPAAQLLAPTRKNPVNYIDASVYGKYTILPGLSFKSTFSYGYTDSKNKEFIPRRPELGRTNLQNYLLQTASNLKRWNWENQLDYVKTFNSVHRLSATLVQSAQNAAYESTSLEGRSFSSEEPFNRYISNAAEVLPPVTDAWEDRLLSTIARGIYNYDSRYYISASVRRDQTSRLFKDNQADYFPSFSAGWNISNEKFFASKDIVNSLKLRASWGRIGNINSVSYYSFDLPLGIQYAVLGAAATTTYKGLYAKREPNPNLVWEKSQSLNIGMDATLLNNKLDITVDYFVKKTLDMILTPIQDLHKGIDASNKNVGTVTNKGIELSLGYHNTVGELSYNLNANFSYIKNNLDNLNGYSAVGATFIAHADNVRNQLASYRSSVGQPLYSYFMIPYLGIFQSEEEVAAYHKNGNLIQPNAKPGDFKFQDTNGDGVINDDDRVFLGSYQPPITYAFTGMLKYRQFDFSLFLQGTAGGKIFNGYKFTAFNASQSGYNLDNRVLNAWTPSNTNTDVPRISTKDNNRNFGTASSWYLEKGNYMRIKNITVGYTFKRGPRIFVGGENLFTITKYSGLDPEVGGIGLDLAQYPVARVYTLGASFKF